MGGHGLGRLEDGLVVLVPHVLPGETVLVQPVKKRKSYLHARLVDVLEPSADRVSPPCSYFGRCGGCDFQHINNEIQAELKNEVLCEHLQRSRVLSASEIDRILPPGKPRNHFGYRQRIRFHIDKNGVPGYRRYHSHSIEPVKSCLLAVPELNAVFSRYIGEDSFHQLIQKHVSQIELQYSACDNSVVVFVHMDRKPRSSQEKLAQRLAGKLLYVKAVILVGPGCQPVIAGSSKTKSPSVVHIGFEQPVPDNHLLHMHFEAGGFCQVNQEQNTALINCLMEWAELSEKERVLDLFCGMGNFTLPMAKQAFHATGMDIKRSSIRSARNNAAENHIPNCVFDQKSALEGIRSLVTDRQKFDLVLLDPPRQGCADVIPYIAKTGAGQIIYISCDPATLSRDLLLLKEEGYAIERIKMFDMFPQTHHMETMVRLQMS